MTTPLIEISESPVFRDISFIAATMRAEDRREIFATRFNDSALELAAGAMHYSFRKWTAGIDGQPVACGGATEASPGVAKVWMFATDNWRKVAGSVSLFVRDKFIIDLMDMGVHRAECLSIEGHDVAHRWLEWLGAVRECEVPLRGKNGETFYQYAWRKPDVCKSVQRAGRATASVTSGGRFCGAGSGAGRSAQT